MKNYFVTVNDEGFIDGWSESEQPNTQKVEADESLSNLFFCVKVEDGKAVLDMSKKTALEKVQNRQDAQPSMGEQMQDMQEAIVQLSEEKAALEQQLLDTQMAMVAMYESNL
ncbi:hypothetical protein [Listeria costaricensis]|uniref:hypothetical protein n=1 Tax=Listeria costaricensis TaxID=2026604 RepID=UPI000C06F7E2|nr:hypothetical protein [Listeria costaricensis]